MTDDAARTETASSWNDLLDRLYAGTWDPKIERFRSKCAYRGLSSADYRLETTLMRLGGQYWDLERHLLRNFRKYAHRSVVERETLWHWLSVAQHHGLPTRLLDWTYSPLVALHFATANIDRYNCDGAIWIVDYAKTHAFLPDRLRHALDDEGANIFTVGILSRTIQRLEELEEMAGDPFVIFFEPPSIDDNIVNQHAFFTVHSDSRKPLDAWLRKHPELWRKIIVPRELKWECRDKLDQANITERVLFPGLDGLSHWLFRHYSPKTDD
ncbi:MAG: FRG domain-containing protein [Opitutales bacterium]